MTDKKLAFVTGILTVIVTLAIGYGTLCGMLGGMDRDIANLKENLKELRAQTTALEERIRALEIKLPLPSDKAACRFTAPLDEAGKLVVPEAGTPFRATVEFTNVESLSADARLYSVVHGGDQRYYVQDSLPVGATPSIQMTFTVSEKKHPEWIADHVLYVVLARTASEINTMRQAHGKSLSELPSGTMPLCSINAVAGH